MFFFVFLMPLLPLLYLKFLIFCTIRPKIINSSPDSLPKTLKTTMKREQKLIASMKTCLLWRHNVSRKHFRVFCSAELYYFKEDRAKAVNKSYLQIFFMIAKSWKKYSFSSINLFFAFFIIQVLENSKFHIRVYMIVFGYLDRWS